MNIILLSRRIGRAAHINLSHPVAVTAVAASLLLLLGGAFAVGLSLGERTGLREARGTPAEWARTLAQQQREVEQLRQEVQSRIDSIAARMGQVNAHVIRLDALGKRLTEMANIDSREFNFDMAPAAGGPESVGLAAEIPDLSKMLAALEDRVAIRDAQLTALENLILSRELREQIVPEGRPVRQGFISSYFGERQDPFTGHQAFHRGVDFAAPEGAEVVAVAAGVVTFVGDRPGYGYTVEVNHGNGYETRYAHNKKNYVQVGQTVTRGQKLAYIGSTGRSTGPHVHFEVLRNGRQVNPLSFIGR